MLILTTSTSYGSEVLSSVIWQERERKDIQIRNRKIKLPHLLTTWLSLWKIPFWAMQNKDIFSLCQTPNWSSVFSFERHILTGTWRKISDLLKESDQKDKGLKGHAIITARRCAYMETEWPLTVARQPSTNTFHVSWGKHSPDKPMTRK